MSGSETGNPLIFDTDDTDPRKYMPLKADRAQRVRYPCHVGNMFKNVTEQVYTAAAGTLPVAQFMSGRVLFDTGASGTVNLPTAETVVQFLNKYYRQVLSRTSIYTNTNGVNNRIANEINVEFYNATAGNITLGMATGLTYYGVVASRTIPAATIAQYKFVIVTTNPAAIDVFPLYASASGSAMSLAPQTPTQLVDYDPATGQLGYITDAVFTNTYDTSTTLMGFNPGSSTPAKMPFIPGAPTQMGLLTRNPTNGDIQVADATHLPAGGSPYGAYPLQIDPATGNLQQRVATIPLTQYAAANQTVTNGTTPNILFDTNLVTPGTTDCTYAAGVFTLGTQNTYSVTVNIAISAPVANNYFTVHTGTTSAGAVLKSSGDTGTQTSFSIPFLINGTAQGTQFCISANNSSGGDVIVLAGFGTIVQVVMVAP
jgi:hypothetical protein